MMIKFVTVNISLVIGLSAAWYVTILVIPAMDDLVSLYG
jgi:hypothetical protein